MRVIVVSSAVMSASTPGTHEASALLQVTSSQHIHNVIQKMDTLKFKEDVSLLDMEEQLNEFKDHVAAVLEEPSTVSPENIKLLMDMITLLDTTFKNELTRQKGRDVLRYTTNRQAHIKCTTDKDTRMHSTTGDVTKEENLVSAKRDKHKGCRKAKKSFETFKADAAIVGAATFGPAIGVDDGSVAEISTLCAKKDQWDLDKRLYKGLATVDHVALCSAEQKDFEDMTCTWLKSKLSTCIAYDECVADINLTNEKSVTEAECTERMKIEVVLAKTKCQLLHLSKVFNNTDSTNLCDNVTVDNSSLACSLDAVPTVTPCSDDANINNPTLPTPSCLPTSAWITTQYSNFNVSYETVTSCKIEATCILPTEIGVHNSTGCSDFPIDGNALGCTFYDRHQDACPDYQDDNADHNCCACGGGAIAVR